MIDRSMTRDTPGQAVALEAAKLFGTCAAETNLASACKQAHQQAGHMCASDPIKLSLNPCKKEAVHICLSAFGRRYTADLCPNMGAELP